MQKNNKKYKPKYPDENDPKLILGSQITRTKTDQKQKNGKVLKKTIKQNQNKHEKLNNKKKSKQKLSRPLKEKHGINHISDPRLSQLRKDIHKLYNIKQLAKITIFQGDQKVSKEITQYSQLKSKQLHAIDLDIAEKVAQSKRILIDIIKQSKLQRLRMDLHRYRCNEIAPIFKEIKKLNKNITVQFNVGAGNHTKQQNKINGKAPLRRIIQQQQVEGQVQIGQLYSYLMVVKFIKVQ